MMKAQTSVKAGGSGRKKLKMKKVLW